MGCALATALHTLVLRDAARGNVVDTSILCLIHQNRPHLRFATRPHMSLAEVIVGPLHTLQTHLRKDEPLHEETVLEKMLAFRCECTSASMRQNYGSIPHPRHTKPAPLDERVRNLERVGSGERVNALDSP